MKIRLVMIAMLVSFTAHAHLGDESKIRYAGDLQYSGFCKAIVENDLSMLKRSVVSKVGDVAPNRRAVLEKLVSDDGMKCNGEDLIKFSKQRGATEVYAYLTNLL